MATKQTILPLLALPELWSAQSGLPEATVLRRLCEWTMFGAFPEHAFRDMRDDVISPFDIYMSERAIRQESAFSAGVTLGDRSMASARWGISCLRAALLRIEDLEFFCDKTSTRPFWIKPPGVLAFILRRKHWEHLAPPPCPEAESVAVRYHARLCAEGQLNVMAAELRMWRGEGKDANDLAEEDQITPDFNYLTPKWNSSFKAAERQISMAAEEGLKRRLEELKLEWDAFRRDHEYANCSPEADPLKDCELELFPDELRVSLRGAKFDVPHRQFTLLLCLAEASLQNKLAATREIERRLWGDSLHKVSRPISDVVRDLRATLRAGANLRENDDLIGNRPGKGYFLNLSPGVIAIKRTGPDVAP